MCGTPQKKDGLSLIGRYWLVKRKVVCFLLKIPRENISNELSGIALLVQRRNFYTAQQLACLPFLVTSHSDALLSINSVCICFSLLDICFLRYSPAKKMEKNNFCFHRALSFGQNHGQGTLESVVRLGGTPN